MLRNPRSGRLVGRDRPPLPGRQFVLNTDLDLDVDACVGAELLVIEGGDGTVQRVLTTLLRVVSAQQLPPIAVVPAGTTNVTSANLNQSRQYDAASRTLRSVQATGQPVFTERRALAVRVSDTPYFGFLFGFGIMCEGIARFSELKSTRPWMSALHMTRIFARSLLTTRNVTTAVTPAGSIDTFVMMATTLDRVLYGMRAYRYPPAIASANVGPQAVGSQKVGLEAPGPDHTPRFHTTWIAAGAASLWRRLPQLARGDAALFDEPGFSSHDVESLTLQFDGLFTIDGELYHSAANPISVSLSPPLRFMVL